MTTPTRTFSGDPFTADEAKALTEQIKGTVTAAWVLLLKAYERQAWSALGYSTWGSYVEAEFNISRSYSYRILDHGRVVRELTAPSGAVVSPTGDTDPFPERHTRELAPLLTEPEAVREVYAEAVERTEGKPTAAVIREVRAERRQQSEYEAAVEEFPDLAHYADRPEKATALATSLRGYAEPERSMRQENLHKAIAAEHRRAAEPEPERGPDHYALADAMFVAANAAAQAISRNGGGATFAEALNTADPLMVATWQQQFASLAESCRAIADACRPTLRRVQ